MPPYLCYRNFTLHSDCLGIVTIPEIYNMYPHNPVFFLTTTLFYHDSDYCTVNSTLSRCTILQSVQLLSQLPNVPSEQTTNNAKQPQAGRLHKTG